MTSLAAARELDAKDDLAGYRDLFVPIDDPEVLAYLDGNSLGRPPLSTVDMMRDLVVRQWGSRMIRSWGEGWIELPEQVGDRLGEACLGAAPGQVILADSTSVCLYKTLHAAIAMRPGRGEIVSDSRNFPTDRYVVQAVAEELGRSVRWVDPEPAGGVTAAQLAEVVGPATAVVTLSHVSYRSAYIADLPAITDLVHAAGGLIVWDLCHSAGSVPLPLDEAGADFAVGCTYKYLNAGPGAPAFLYVRSAHQSALRQPIRGWMSTHDIFAMQDGYRAADGMRRMLSGTPAVLGAACVGAGVDMIAEAGIDRIRAKSTELTRLAVGLYDEWLAPLGFRLASPRADERRGAHITVDHPRAEELTKVFIDHGVIIDFRVPDGVRIGLSPLTTSFEELWLAMDRMRDLAS